MDKKTSELKIEHLKRNTLYIVNKIVYIDGNEGDEEVLSGPGYYGTVEWTGKSGKISGIKELIIFNANENSTFGCFINDESVIEITDEIQLDPVENLFNKNEFPKDFMINEGDIYPKGKENDSFDFTREDMIDFAHHYKNTVGQFETTELLKDWIKFR